MCGVDLRVVTLVSSVILQLLVKRGHHAQFSSNCLVILKMSQGNEVAKAFRYLSLYP